MFALLLLSLVKDLSMSYSEFTLAQVVEQFGLIVEERVDLFAPAPQAVPSPLLQANLDENVPLALALQTEKARSELIIAPILVEVRRQMKREVSLFSGVEFTVDAARGLNGVCDFLLSQSREQLFVRSPVLAIMEAKNEDIRRGIGQCTAAMIAAQLFNERQQNPIPAVYGAVTTGDIWRFLRLESSTLYVDSAVYYLDNLREILGVLLTIAGGNVRDQEKRTPTHS
jgi:hypothetical protein